MGQAAQGTIHLWQRILFLAVLCCAVVTAGGAVSSYSAQGEPAADSDGRTLLFGVDGCTRELVQEKLLTCLFKRSSQSDKTLYPLRFAVHTQPGARLVLEDRQAGFWPLRGRQLGKPGRADELGDGLLDLEVTESTATVTLRALAQKSAEELGQVTVHLAWETPDALDEEVDRAGSYTDAAQRQSILDRLQRELALERQPLARTRVLIDIADLRSRYWRADRRLNPAIPATQTQATREALYAALAGAEHQRFLISSARLLSTLAHMAYDDPAERSRLIPKLEQAAAQTTVLPGEQSELHLYRAELLRRRNDLRGARAAFEAAVATARWIGDQQSAERKRQRWLLEEFREGLDLEQELQKEEAVARQQSPCDKASRLQDLGWLRLLIWEMSPSAATAAKAASGNRSADPPQLFDEVFQLTRGPGSACPNARLAQYALTSKARLLALLPPVGSDAAALRDWAARVQQISEEARALSGKQLSKAVDLDLQLAAARLELRQLHIDKAAEHFAAAEKLAREIGSLDAEDRWEAVCGAAATQLRLEQQGQRRERLAQAERLLEECSGILDDMIGKVSLAYQANAMESRERRLGPLISLLGASDSQALKATVFDAMRRASRRGTAPYRWPFGDGAAPAELTQLMDEYHRLRTAFEEERTQSWPQQQAPGHDRPADKQRRIEARQQALDLIDKIFMKLRELPGADAEWRALPAVPERDLLIICHSGDWDAEQGIFCITALGKELRTVQFAPGRLSPAEQAEKLLGPWRSKLPPLNGSSAAAPIQRLHILGHGWLREQDLSAWLLDGQPLMMRLPIVYGLDIRPVVQKPHGDGALFAIHPSGHLEQGADPILQMLHAQLPPQGLKPRYFSADVDRFSAAPVNKTPSHGQLYPEHSRASLFVALGHFKPGLCSEDASPLGAQAIESPWLRSLCLADQNSLWPADVLLAPQVPRSVMLLGCSSGKQVQAISTSSVSMASAYVLRGSQAVLGTVRDLPQPLARQVLCHISRDPRVSTPQLDLATAVQQAQKAIRSHTPCPGGMSASELARDDWDWSALRVYVP